MSLYVLRHYRSVLVHVALALVVFVSTAAAQAGEFHPPSFLLQAETQQTPGTPPADPTRSNDQAQGQQQTVPTATQPVKFYQDKNFFKDLLRDEKKLWTSPLHLGREDAKWMLPLTGATAALIATDGKVADALPSSGSVVDTSHTISDFGDGFVVFGAPAALYAIGRLKDNERVRETGLLAEAAVIHANLIVQVIKLATNRRRPIDGGDGHFWNGGKSFVSGHAANTWAMATVLAHEYPDKPIVKYGAYAWATAVSISRVTGQKHFPADVLVGGTLGYLIGRYIATTHATPHNRFSTTMISPYVNQSTRSYGLAVSIQF